jgi:peptidoglycan lytic transglycosylase
MASFYWQGSRTASGEAFDRGAMTAAHPTLPFNTRVRVMHLQTRRSVEVRINDRGPFKAGRVIDLSQKAAEELGITSRGLARVRLEVVSN